MTEFGGSRGRYELSVTLRRYRYRLARTCHTSTVSKFKIGQSVRLRSTLPGGSAFSDEYRIVGQVRQADHVVRYRVRSSADEQEMVVTEHELQDWRNSKVFL
jgi:hypothetical protein